MGAILYVGIVPMTHPQHKHDQNTHTHLPLNTQHPPHTNHIPPPPQALQQQVAALESDKTAALHEVHELKLAMQPVSGEFTSNAHSAKPRCVLCMVCFLCVWCVLLVMVA